MSLTTDSTTECVYMLRNMNLIFNIYINIFTAQYHEII